MAGDFLRHSFIVFARDLDASKLPFSFDGNGDSAPPSRGDPFPALERPAALLNGVADLTLPGIPSQTDAAEGIGHALEELGGIGMFGFQFEHGILQLLHGRQVTVVLSGRTLLQFLECLGEAEPLLPGQTFDLLNGLAQGVDLVSEVGVHKFWVQTTRQSGAVPSFPAENCCGCGTGPRRNTGDCHDAGPLVSKQMWSAVEYCHVLLRERLLPGDWAVDATAGNGHDTYLLTQLTGPDGRVFAFDVQAQAIAATRQLLERGGVPEACYQLIQSSHVDMASHLPPEPAGRYAAVIFNLGYLPGGVKRLTTRAETTLPAVRLALELLRPGGLLLLVLYPGHDAGADEARVLREFASGLSPRQWQVTEYRPLNTRQPPPSVLAVGKV